jgi:hypothetical protein
VDFVIYKLAKRVNNPSWLVALKALMTFHRLLRECDASFVEQVRNSSRCKTTAEDASRRVFQRQRMPCTSSASNSSRQQQGSSDCMVQARAQVYGRGACHPRLVGRGAEAN